MWATFVRFVFENPLDLPQSATELFMYFSILLSEKADYVSPHVKNDKYLFI